MKSKPKTMTVDELATITLNAFNQLHKDMQAGFDAVRREVREDLNKVEQRLTERFERLEAIMCERVVGYGKLTSTINQTHP